MSADRDVASLEPAFRDDAGAWLRQLTRLGVRVKVTRARSSRATQARLYREYQRKLAAGIPTLPAAPPGHSQHEKGLAWDMVVLPGSTHTLEELGRAWQASGRRWGGTFGDPVHFDWGLR